MRLSPPSDAEAQEALRLLRQRARRLLLLLRLDDASDVHALLKAARAELDRLGHPEYNRWSSGRRGARVTRLQSIQPDSILVIGCGEPFNPASVPDRARAMQRRADATAVTREREGFAREREALSRLQRELPAELDLVPPPPPLVPEALPRITHGGRLLTDLEVQRFKHVQQAAVAEAVAATRGTHRTDVLPYSSPKPFVPKLAWVGSHSGRWRTDDVRRAQMADTKREGTGAKAEVLSRAACSSRATRAGRLGAGSLKSEQGCPTRSEGWTPARG